MCRTLITLALLSIAVPAYAVDFGLKVEPGVALPLSSPQADIYKLGGAGAVKALFGLNRYLDIGPSAHLLLLRAATSEGKFGYAWALGGGLRLKRPHDAENGTSPWVDADALYVRTGDLNRFGFAAAAGLAFPLGETRAFWLGPFVRYFHIIQPDRAGYDNRDSKTLILGVSLEWGSGIARTPEAAAAPVAVTEAAPATPEPVAKEPPAKEPAAAPDRDKDDGVYKKLVVKKDRLELKEKLYFALDKARLEPASYPVLDEVVTALQDNREFKVQVEGHTDSSGTDEHNQGLSERRAAAVVQYLVSHGVAQDRLVSKGFGSSRPVDTNETKAGRERNRRVDFIILNDGSTH